MSGSLVRIVLLACFALGGTIFALVLHYRVHHEPPPPHAPSATSDAGELPAPELLPVESAPGSH